ncbi:PmbA protein [Desulfitispora alkaliphila]|uniref:TldD/PmbA family protein n=1 Tax=Desulfitispora alkaliphila TaxID=622674 RepID=UPI003D24FFC8
MPKTNYNTIAEKAIEMANRAKMDSAEVYISSSKELNIEVSNQEVETLKMAEEIGMGIRVLKDGKMGFSYTTSLDETSLKEALEQAIANCPKTTVDENNILPNLSDTYEDLGLQDRAIQETPVEDKINFAKALETSARNYDKRVVNTRTSSYQDANYEIVIANTSGKVASYNGSYCGGYGYLVAQEGEDNQTGFGLQFSLKYGDLDPEKIGAEAAEKAVRMLGAKTIESEKAAVVLDPYIATNFLGVIAPALTADSVQKGKSLFANKVDKKVASELLNIIDDGSMSNGIMSAPFDDEGVPTSRTSLIQEGVLQGFLHNTYTAKKDGVTSTGNCSRSGFKSTPEVGTTNFYIAKGNTSPEELIGEIDRGLYVTEVMGMHTANPISGDFSLGAAGIWIENGKLSYPVRGVAIAGNILELLSSVDCVGSDLTFYFGKGAPTLRIPRMSISG